MRANGSFSIKLSKILQAKKFLCCCKKLKNCNSPWNTKNENGSRQMPVALPAGLNCSGNFGQCWWCERPTSVQVQTKVEERSISEGTEQIVAAFESGHQDWARDDLWGHTQRKMIHFSFTVESQVKDEQPSDKCVQKHLVRKINRSHWSEWLLILKKKKEKLWILFSDFLFDFKSNYISTVLIKCLLVYSLNAVAAVCNLKFSFHCTAFLTRLKKQNTSKCSWSFTFFIVCTQNCPYEVCRLSRVWDLNNCQLKMMW